MSDSQYAELVKYISAMIQEIGEFRKETAERDEAIRKETEERDEAIRKELREFRKETAERFDKIEARLAKVEEEIRDIKYAIKIMPQDITGIRKRQVDLEDRVEIVIQK
jgi:septal ring factor EnvC (AmiA/AmiB activator)